MTAIVVENSLFKQMQSYKTLECNQKERQQLKHTFIDRIKEKVSLRWDRANKLLQVIDEIVYKATDRGYSFNGRKTLAEKCKVSLRTVDKAIKILKESNEVVVAYRHNPSSNGYKTPIILLKGHEYFRYWKELLNIENNVECKVETSAKADASKVEGKVTDLYLFNTKKQESNINISNLPNNRDRIVQYVVNRVQDSIKQGTKITFLSSYIDKLIHSLEKQALYAENMRLNKIRKQQDQEASRLAEKLGIKKTVPLYDWLNK